MRYYEEKYPDVDDLVMVKVWSIAEMGAYVKLVSFERELVPRLGHLSILQCLISLNMTT